MMRRRGMRALTIVSASLLATGCGTTSAVPGDVVNAGITYAAEQALRRGEPLPAAASSFNYADTHETDLRLHASLNRLSDVRVILPPSTQELPERLRYWTAKIERSGKTVVTCDIDDSPGFGDVFTAYVLRALLGAAAGAVKEYALYRPAAAFNAIVEKDSGSGEVKGVRFVKGDLQTAKARYSRCA
jgi:hypothetical protein